MSRMVGKNIVKKLSKASTQKNSSQISGKKTRANKKEMDISERAIAPKRQRSIEDKIPACLSSEPQEDTDCNPSARKYMKTSKLLFDKGLFNNTENKVQDILNTLYSRFESKKDSVKAASMSKYMRDKFEYFGIRTPERKALYKDLWTKIDLLNSSEIQTLLFLTWQKNQREFHYFTIEFLEKKMMNIYDIRSQPTREHALKTLDFVKFFLTDKSWWDTVDTLAIKVVGPLVKIYPEELHPVMDKWNADQNMWLCRTSIIYQNGFKSSTETDFLFRYCLSASKSEEFFVQKAIGWALREHYKVNPGKVKGFVEDNKHILPKLSIKEALKHDK